MQVTGLPRQMQVTGLPRQPAADTPLRPVAISLVGSASPCWDFVCAGGARRFQRVAALRMSRQRELFAIGSDLILKPMGTYETYNSVVERFQRELAKERKKLGIA